MPDTPRDFRPEPEVECVMCERKVLVSQAYWRWDRDSRGYYVCEECADKKEGEDE